MRGQTFLTRFNQVVRHQQDFVSASFFRRLRALDRQARSLTGARDDRRNAAAGVDCGLNDAHVLVTRQRKELARTASKGERQQAGAHDGFEFLRIH